MGTKNRSLKFRQGSSEANGALSGDAGASRRADVSRLYSPLRQRLASTSAPAQDLDDRLQAHNDGRGAAFTFKHRPFRLVYSEAFNSQLEALTRERQLKRWSRAKKMALISGDLAKLKYLSKRRF